MKGGHADAHDLLYLQSAPAMAESVVTEFRL